MYTMSQNAVLFVTIGRYINTLRHSVNNFSFNTLYIVHTDYIRANEPKMRQALEQNIQLIRTQHPQAKFIQLDIYDLYRNVFILRSYFQKYTNYSINCDITGGDKIISIALLYAVLLENDRKNIRIYYQRREEDLTYEEERFIPIVKFPILTPKQRKFMEVLGNGKSVAEMMDILDISKNNIWNYANLLEEEELIRIDRDKELIICNLPYNFYYHTISDGDVFFNSPLLFQFEMYLNSLPLSEEVRQTIKEKMQYITEIIKTITKNKKED